MHTFEASAISRRGLLRLGALTGVAAVISPTMTAEAAKPTPTPMPTSTPVVCNDVPASPDAALTLLLKGNSRWAAGDQMHPGEDSTRRMCVATNPQTPFAAILSCSDSRVPPELVFDQGLGDLFVARVAGNTSGGNLADTLYFGTHELGAQVLFVMGHSECGAVKVAVETVLQNPNPNHPFEFVRLIFPAVKAARRIVAQKGGDPNDPKQVVPVAIDQNVINVANILRAEFIDLIGEGKLLVAGGRYDLINQQVTVLTVLSS